MDRMDHSFFTRARIERSLVFSGKIYTLGLGIVELLLDHVESTIRHRDSSHGETALAQRAQVPPQAVGAATRNQAVDLAMRAPPDRNRARQQRAARGRELQPAAAS